MIKCGALRYEVVRIWRCAHIAREGASEMRDSSHEPNGGCNLASARAGNVSNYPINSYATFQTRLLRKAGKRKARYESRLTARQRERILENINGKLFFRNSAIIHQNHHPKRGQRMHVDNTSLSNQTTLLSKVGLTLKADKCQPNPG